MNALPHSCFICRRRRRGGISLLEVVISSLLVGLVVAGAMTGLASVSRGRTVVSDVGRAEQLAQDLLAEMMTQPYKDEGSFPLFGRELDELGLAWVRSNFDDVDDYVLWNESPPQERTGTPLPNLAGWQRSVSVAWVDRSNPANTSPSPSGLKRITVTVRLGGQTLATAVGLRAETMTMLAGTTVLPSTNPLLPSSPEESISLPSDSGKTGGSTKSGQQSKL